MDLVYWQWRASISGLNTEPVEHPGLFRGILASPVEHPAKAGLQTPVTGFACGFSY
jgi:hypothetical protein